MGFELPNAFSFLQLTEDMPINRLYIRDNFGLWYHQGLQDVCTSLAGAVTWLRRRIRRRNFDRVAVVGVSAGAYATLVLGARLGVDRVDAIAPRTLLQPDPEHYQDRDRHGILASLAQVQQMPNRDRRADDLQHMFVHEPPKWGQCTVHFDPWRLLDAYHARRLEGVAGLSYAEHPGGGHALGRSLFDQPEFRAGLCFQN